jgi:glucose-1-phosphate thymidylyltransferase
MKVIVLAAGFATRLYPLTRDRPKPLLDVGGRPVLSRLLDRVIALDSLEEIVVVTNGKFHAQFAAWANAYETAVPIRLVNDRSTSDDDKLGGVADLALALERAGDVHDGFLIVAGDNLLDFDLRPFQRAFLDDGRPLMLCRTFDGPVPPRRFGEVHVDAEQNITRFVEKPEQPTSPLASACIYFLPPAVTRWIAAYLEAGGNRDAPGHFIAWLSEHEKVRALPLEGEIYDIGNHETLARARKVFGARERA